MRQLFAIQGIMLIFFVVIGNGVRSMTMATTMLSMGEFASFLNISVERTHLLVEALICGAIIALALAPFLISPRSAPRVTVWAAAFGAISYVVVGITLHLRPALATREVLVLITFLISGSAVAFFAPLAQMAISGVDDAKSRTMLTMLWTGAQPIAFLLTPQLVKFVAFDIGIGNFFLVLALLPVSFLLLAPMIFRSLQHAPPPPPLGVERKHLIGFLVLILAFQAWTAAVSLAGVTDPVTLFLLVVFVLVGAGIVFTRSRWMPANARLSQGAMFLLGLLFLLQLPTTGMFDNAYLVRHLCSNYLLADRASLGAICQIAGVFGTGALILRKPELGHRLLAAGVLMVMAGSLLTMAYPYLAIDSDVIFLSKMTSSAGAGIATTILVNEIVTRCANNRILMLAPAFAIVIGTEVGIEGLEMIFEVAMEVQQDETVAYQAVFLAQCLILLVPVAMLVDHWLMRRGRLGQGGAPA